MKTCMYLGFSLLLLSSCGNKEASAPEPNVAAPTAICPEIMIYPHTRVKFSEKLAPGIYDLAIELDGNKENCTLTIGEIIGSKDMGGFVQSPMTKIESSCKLAYPGNVFDDGTLAWLSIKKTGDKKTVPLSIQMSLAGKIIAESNTPIEYKPTELRGKGCGMIDYAEITLHISAK
jgi:hypothetical protein